jgi:hypothetical protein
VSFRKTQERRLAPANDRSIPNAQVLPPEALVFHSQGRTVTTLRTSPQHPFAALQTIFDAMLGRDTVQMELAKCCKNLHRAHTVLLTLGPSSMLVRAPLEGQTGQNSRHWIVPLITDHETQVDDASSGSEAFQDQQSRIGGGLLAYVPAQPRLCNKLANTEPRKYLPSTF